MNSQWILSLFDKHLTPDEVRRFYNLDEDKDKAFEKRYGADMARIYRSLDNAGNKRSANFAELSSEQAEQEFPIKSGLGTSIAEMLQEYEKQVALEAAEVEKPPSSSTSTEDPIVIEMKKKYMTDLGLLIETIGTALLVKHAVVNKSTEYSSRKALTDATHIVNDMSLKLWKIHYKTQYGINF